MRELADQVVELTRSKSPVVEEPIPPDNPKQRQPHVSAVRQQLGWNLTIPLDHGLPKAVDYIRTLA